MIKAKKRRQIKTHVDKLLRLAAIEGPPVDVVQVARMRGAQLRYAHGKGSAAGLLKRENGNIIIGVNLSQPRTRQRFTVAHELAWLELSQENVIHIDEHFPLLKDYPSSQAIEPFEREANAFASELLMPTVMLERDLKGKIIDYEDDKLIHNLANRYKVSRTAMTVRLVDFIVTNTK